MIEFVKVIPNKNQFKELYLLLSHRKNSISHDKLPSFEEHRKFVSENPYIEWYLLFKNKELLGSVYIQSDNSIGINLNLLNEDDLIEIIKFIKDNHQPLPSIKSLRRGEFFINIPSNDSIFVEILKKLNKSEIQRSFII
jgi:hypothetical protein